MLQQEKIAVIGLGYVGLPVAIAFAKKFPHTVGFDIDRKKIGELKDGIDRTGEVASDALKAATMKFTADIEDLKGCTFFVVAVPTPIDHQKKPDLRPVISASETVGKAIKAGAVVVFESTVYPGVTEDICGPIIEKVSGLKVSRDFKLAYSPERINPGDKAHTLETIVKVVSGEDAETLERVAKTYGSIITAGVHRAASIKVAEAAKVIENTQRDLNIALMNELAVIFDRLGIRTQDVLKAAGTKWNFLKFTPGLVGGHCIGVDPFYLTTKAEELGYTPQVILAGRRINDSMGAFVAQKLIKLMLKQKISLETARVGIFGLTFKENVPDIRNSKVPDIINELTSFGLHVQVTDALANAEEVHEEYGLKLSPLEQLHDLDAVVLAVPHAAYLSEFKKNVLSRMKPRAILVDVKSVIDEASLASGQSYWSL